MTVRPSASLLPLSAALAAALSTMLAGCGDAASQPRGGMPPPEVAVVTVQPRTAPAVYEYTGQTVGYREVEVRARVTGILQKRNFTEGGPVAKGQSLFTIDPVPFETTLARTEADLAAAEARLSQAKRNAARLKPLYAEKAVSQKEYDDAVSAEQIAEADHKVARARVAEAKLNLDYTRVESPIAGVAGRAQRSEGSLVSGPDVLLTSVTQVDPIYVSFGIPDAEQLRLRRESEAGRLVLPRNGQFEVTLKLADGGPYARTGRMAFNDVRINGATGTSEARAELPNPGGLLRPGQFVRVFLSGASRPNAISVPQRAVLEGPKGKFVYVVNAESKAEPRPVQVGEWSGDAWIIASGLNAGDKVIVDGVMKIGPGAPVRIADPAAAQQGGAAKGGDPAKAGDPSKGDAAKSDAKK